MNTEGNVSAPQAAGPVWVKAKNYEGKGAWKLCRVNGGESLPLRIVRPDFIVDAAGKTYNYFEVEYLEENCQQLFTREQVEAALNAGIGIGVLCHDPKMAQERGDEYMNTNFPKL